MSTPNPTDRLITLMSSAVSAGAEDALRLATALREGRIDLDDVQRWYSQRREQSMDIMRQIGDELGTLQRQGFGRFVTTGRDALHKRAKASRRAASRSRRRSISRRRASSRRASSSRRRSARSSFRRSARAAGRGMRRAVSSTARSVAVRTQDRR